jgi:hypothetical protein
VPTRGEGLDASARPFCRSRDFLVYRIHDWLSGMVTSREEASEMSDTELDVAMTHRGGS